MKTNAMARGLWWRWMVVIKVVRRATMQTAWIWSCVCVARAMGTWNVIMSDGKDLGVVCASVMGVLEVELV
jgi:hypothetical protein